MTQWKWTSPIRRSGSLDLPPIPNEIYLEILNYLRPDSDIWMGLETRKDFCNLALVCRFFSSVMLPWIFEDLIFVERNSYSQISSPESSTVSANFCRSVLDGDSTALLLSTHVKRWAFSGSLGQTRWTPAFLSMYFETLQHMPNLFEISLSHIPIPKDLFKRLSNVPRLETLKLDGCFFDGAVQEKHLKKFKSLHLKNLRISHLHGNRDLQRLVPHLNMLYLIRLELDFYTHLGSLPLPNDTLPLEHLYLDNIEDPLYVLEVLKRTPSLKALRMPYFPELLGEQLAETALGSIHIPRLAELEAPWSLCRLILPGRPVSCLSLVSCTLKIGIDEVRIIQMSSRLINHLKIPVEFYTDIPFAEHFPELQKLEIRGVSLGRKTCGEVINTAVGKWSCHQRLHFLAMEFSDFTPSSLTNSEETLILESLTSKFPSLTEVNFSYMSLTKLSSPYLIYYDHWNYTRVVGGSWHRRISCRR